MLFKSRNYVGKYAGNHCVVLERTKKYVGKYCAVPEKQTGRIGPVLSSVLLLICLLCFFAARWYVSTYGQTGFDSILYTLFGGLGGAESGLIRAFILEGVVSAVVCTVLVSFLLFFCPKKTIRIRQITVYPFRRWVSGLLAAVICLGTLIHAAVSTGFPEYIYYLFHPTAIYEECYVNPDSVEITFPEKKRNLIYIFLESMETAYFGKEQGGAMDVNLVPELYELAEHNINFSQNDSVGGFRSVNGTTWTIGAMVGHTSGVPLKTPDSVEDWQNGYGKEGVFLPGLTCLTDILHENGYYQTLMVGSVASFGGRETYYETHGADYIYELTTARWDGIVPSDYFVWWGMEDKYLFEYAKQELAEISQMDQPFAFTMLTVDTHHIGGYKCEYCQDTHKEQYSNVMSCSSRQVAAFVEWLRQQDFYDNTTVIICGDHPSMDKGYFDRNVPSNYIRRVYNCFINSAVDTAYSKNREFTSLDLFPTTLAAMGCTIEGERLGLGTNLFSGVPTFAESMGFARFYSQLAGRSEYYSRVFRKETGDSATAPTQ